MTENYYQVLQVQDYSALEHIKTAYKKMALLTHPDKN